MPRMPDLAELVGIRGTRPCANCAAHCTADEFLGENYRPCCTPECMDAYMCIMALNEGPIVSRGPGKVSGHLVQDVAHIRRPTGYTPSDSVYYWDPVVVYVV